MSRLSNPISDQSDDQSTSSDLLLPDKQTHGTVQTEVQTSYAGGNNEKPRLLTVSFSCVVIVQSWLMYGLSVGYISPVLSDLEGSGGNSSAPLDKLVYQDLFTVSQARSSYKVKVMPAPTVCSDVVKYMIDNSIVNKRFKDFRGVAQKRAQKGDRSVVLHR